jgi:malonyl CoA-acyl carrier protein transacylase
MREVVKRKITAVIEIGPGKVLTGLMRRITKEVKTANMETPGDLQGLGQFT